MNAHEQLAREHKAERLTEFILGQFEVPDLDRALRAGVLPHMGAGWWEDIAREAGVNPPSADTIALVVTKLQSRVEPHLKVVR